MYIIDSSSLIGLNRFHADVFISLWSCLEKSVTTNQLIAPKKVFEDLQHMDDEIAKWATINSKMFKDENDKTFITALSDVINRHQNWIDLDSEKNGSDPYVVALALLKRKESKETLEPKEVIVITEESQDLARLKIPSVCNGYNLRCLNLHQFFQEEGWKF
ncbi:MAG: DUF4411 family protein [Candidatus Micrarchaeia archaeon]